MYTAISITLAQISATLTLISALITQVPPKTYAITPESPLTQDILWKGYEKLKIICSCESWGEPFKEPRQFRDGIPLWSDYGTPDVGACQIHTPVWDKKAKEMNLDIINSKEDNLTMARWILDNYGENQWNPSKRCWNGV